MANRYQDPPFSADDQDRGYEPARPKGEGDPLAELARLIGQTDPFANFGRASQAPRPDDHQQPEDVDDVPSSPPPWLQRANAHSSARHDAARPDSTRQDFETLHPVQRYADEHQEPEPDYHQAPAFAAPADHQHPEDPDRYDQALYGELPGQHAPGHETYQDDAYAYADGYDDATEQPARKRGGGMMTVAVVLALAVVGTGAAFGYRTYMGSPRSGEPPVIKADTGPNKVVPPSATASADSNGKLIQDRLGGAAPEKLVSREEQPVNVQDATKAGPRVVFPPLNQNNNPPPTASVAPPAAGKALTGSATVQSDEPRKIRTFAVRGDSDPNATPAAKQVPKPAPPARAQAANNANASANAPLSLSPQAAPAAAAPPARVANNAPTAIAPAPASGGGYLVQIASQRNEADAQSSFRALQGKYPSVLGSRSSVIKRADLGPKGVYYRAMVGPFASSDEAASFCGNLKSAGGQCVVQRN